MAALLLMAAFLLVEVVAGLLAGSLALLADAAHMLPDAVALGLALLASAMAARPPSGRWTFGFGRVEILAALANGIVLALVGAWIVYVAARRLISPQEVRGSIVLVVALLGIAVNLVAALLLAPASRRS